MQSPQQQLRQVSVVDLDWLLLRLEEIKRALRVLEDQIEQLRDSDDTPKRGRRSRATLGRATARPMREEFNIKGRTVWLPKTLARLMRALLVSPGTWKTTKDLAVLLGDNDRAARPHAVAQAVYRLRRELRRAGMDGELVKGHRSHGWRLNFPDKG